MVEEGQRVLSRAEKRRYAMALDDMETGLYGHNLALFKAVTFTTRGDFENDAGRRKNTPWGIQASNMTLRQRMREEDILDADCMCREWSPLNKLMHTHGLWRLRRPMSSDDIYPIAREYWKRIHWAHRVEIEDIYSAEAFKKYIAKHTFKNYIGIEYGRMRLLKTNNWLPAGIRLVRKILRRWAIEHGGLIEPEEVDYDAFIGEYVPYAWDVAEEKKWKWCCGELVELWFQSGVVFLHGTEIKDLRLL